MKIERKFEKSWLFYTTPNIYVQRSSYLLVPLFTRPHMYSRSVKCFNVQVKWHWLFFVANSSDSLCLNFVELVCLLLTFNQPDSQPASFFDWHDILSSVYSLVLSPPTGWWLATTILYIKPISLDANQAYYVPIIQGLLLSPSSMKRMRMEASFLSGDYCTTSISIILKIAIINYIFVSCWSVCLHVSLSQPLPPLSHSTE